MIYDLSQIEVKYFETKISRFIPIFAHLFFIKGEQEGEGHSSCHDN